ncbi:hypothetical protein GQX74_010566 [Glossina fuscipes]|nr:hypothetical protein GQX74_010566 [Glossina fuscipes]
MNELKTNFEVQVDDDVDEQEVKVVLRKPETDINIFHSLFTGFSNQQNTFREIHHVEKQNNWKYCIQELRQSNADLVKQRERKAKYFLGHLSARILSENIWHLQKFDDEAIEDIRRNFDKLIIDEKAAAPPKRNSGRMPRQKCGGFNIDSKDTVQSVNRNTGSTDIVVVANSNQRSCGQRAFIDDKIKLEDDETLPETNGQAIAQPVKDICEVLKLLKIQEKTATIPLEHPRLTPPHIHHVLSQRNDGLLASRKKRTLGMVEGPEQLNGMEASIYNVNKAFRKRLPSSSPTPDVKACDSKYKTQGAKTPIKKKSARSKKKVEAKMCETNNKASNSLNISLKRQPIQAKKKCTLRELISQTVKSKVTQIAQRKKGKKFNIDSGKSGNAEFDSAPKEDSLTKEKKKKNRVLRKMALREMRVILHESKKTEGNCAKCKSTRKRVSKKIGKIASSLPTKAAVCNEKEQKRLNKRARRKQVATAALNVGLFQLLENNSKNILCESVAMFEYKFGASYFYPPPTLRAYFPHNPEKCFEDSALYVHNFTVIGKNASYPRYAAAVKESEVQVVLACIAFRGTSKLVSSQHAVCLRIH